MSLPKSTTGVNQKLPWNARFHTCSVDDSGHALDRIIAKRVASTVDPFFDAIRDKAGFRRAFCLSWIKEWELSEVAVEPFQ